MKIIWVSWNQKARMPLLPRKVLQPGTWSLIELSASLCVPTPFFLETSILSFKGLWKKTCHPSPLTSLNLCVSNPAAEGKRNEWISMNLSPKFLGGRPWARISHVLILDQSSVSAWHPIVQNATGGFLPWMKWEIRGNYH